MAEEHKPQDTPEQALTTQVKGASDQPAASEPSAEKPPRKPRRWGLLLLGLLLFFFLLTALGGVGAGYWVWRDMNQTLVEQSKQLNDLGMGLANLDQRPQLQALQSKLAQESSTQAQASAALERKLQSLQDAVTSVHDLTTRDQRAWALAETEYLMRVATDRLRLMRDFDGAIAALEAADQRLHRFADPRLLPVREALADEIRTLRDFKRPDLVGIALRLDRMTSNLQMMPLADRFRDEAEKFTPAAEAGEKTGVSGVLSTVWSKVSEGITIRHHDKPIESLPDAETELHLHQLLRLRLEAARIAVLRQDNHEYHQQLTAAQDWVKAYYRGESSEALALELQTLQAENLRPELPDITASLIKLQKLAQPSASEEAGAS